MEKYVVRRQWGREEMRDEPVASARLRDDKSKDGEDEDPGADFGATSDRTC